MERAMKQMNAAAVALQLRLWLGARSPVTLLACILLLAMGSLTLWLLPQRALQADQHRAALRQAAAPASVAVPGAAASANDNLALFYGALGEKRYAEQQVKTLFGLAAKSGLTLSQGEYKTGYDRNARLHTYQVTLPVRGSYAEIWKFSLLALRTIPFASLDELSFKRETINDAQLEARLRLTLYLADQPGGPR
jgi:hypothetical protein